MAAALLTGPAAPARCSHGRTLLEFCATCSLLDDQDQGHDRCVHAVRFEDFCHSCESRGLGAFCTEVRRG